MTDGVMAARHMDAVEALNADVKRLARALDAKVEEVPHVPGAAGPEKRLLQLEAIGAQVRTLAKKAEANKRKAEEDAKKAEEDTPKPAEGEKAKE